MYAVVEISGKQFMVEKGDHILTDKIDGEVGQELQFDNVILTSDSENVSIGQPIIDGVSVKATIMDYERGKKILVFKKKRRKGYKVKRGHRQDYTQLRIDDIVVGG